MSRIAKISVFSAFVLTTQAACVAKDVSANCTVEGAKYLSGAYSDSEICRGFEDRLSKAIAADGTSAKAGALTVAIQLHERGSAEAQVSRQDGGEVTDYPVVAVDVMDRPLAKDDLDKLADSVAQMLKTN
ncbi:hypothetical protein [Pontixanthobacter aquaemixtae]|uniref:Secreted protein n=1 Tax=Pontixanthobacter aquaemixtae TaxID=1958940 RepID=A0A844ZSM5_9SPHN|nr:hypothetical protein [Pontixanthobacter aquaemixtae]MXO90855.1 hypothetical protein [Pontixanthobacter aquaemixtae]